MATDWSTETFTDPDNALDHLLDCYFGEPAACEAWQYQIAIDAVERAINGEPEAVEICQLNVVPVSTETLEKLKRNAKANLRVPALGTPKPSTTASLVFSRSELADLPEPEPLIDNVLDRRTVAALIGHTGTLKTWLALDWASCIATGKRWQGRRDVIQGPVLYIASEGAHGLNPRLTTWETAWQTPIPDDKFHVYPRPIQLTNAAALSELVEIVHQLRPILIVIDTLARTAVGLDENSAKDVGQYVDAAYRLRDATDSGTVLIVHHTGKDTTTTRGSSALEDGVDTLYLAKGDWQGVDLDRKKRKDGPLQDSHRLRLESFPGTSVPYLQIIGANETNDTADKLLSHFVSHYSATGASTAMLRETSGLKRATLHRALNSLVAAGDLVNVGTRQRAYYVLPSDCEESLSSHRLTGVSTPPHLVSLSHPPIGVRRETEPANTATLSTLLGMDS